ncbi:MAG TPA: 4-(cytidine 5'-diphospho)-2-C-methyl-D-erythritol kinase [Candidatus Pygmaiobacter gallistercoris]|nr:4-(cytidine 5'-diphospho)-2-C-methyl-D-erythritol kinase [Candidatus Pygmaiobacter gallistercoris]
MKGATLLAPAKLNLTLDITGVQEDGYHTMDMLMQAVSLYERVKLRRSDRLEISAAGASLPLGPKNVAWKAAVAFFQQTGLLAGAQIRLEKHAPIRAGMGGGSADAAAVLVGLNLIYGAQLTLEELCRIGATVGADVPFALVGGTARVRGFGEQIASLPPLPDCLFVVCMPEYGISTPQAFAAYDEVGAETRPDNDAAERAIRDGALGALFPHLGNALQRASAGKDTERICGLLTDAGAKAALMTGSGAATYGIFTSVLAAQRGQKALQRAGFDRVWTLVPARTGPVVEEIF